MSDSEKIKVLEKRLQLLEDKEALAALMYRYCRHVDEKNFTAYSECFTKDAKFDFGPFGQHVGRAKIREVVAAAEGPFDDMQHSYSNLEFKVDGDRATGQGYLWCAIVRHRSDPSNHFDFGGPLYWHFERTPDEGWLLSSMTHRLMWKTGQDTEQKFNEPT